MKILGKATIEPTERSMPPERITKVAPMAATPRKALSPTRFTRTRREPKLENEMQPRTYRAIRTKAVARRGMYLARKGSLMTFSSEIFRRFWRAGRGFGADTRS